MHYTDFELTLDYFIIFIIVIKFVFVISAVGHLFLTYFSVNQELQQMIDPTFLYWKEHTEFIFIISMSILLIYQFHPSTLKKPVAKETATLFFLFGCVLIFTANWGLFFSESKWYKQLVSALK
jgi:hypothetical protein